ncbi:MAG: VanW family protein [Chloroflexota bacterium]
MSVTSHAKQIKAPPANAVMQAVMALAGGVTVFLVIGLVVWLGFGLRYSGRIYPGVSVAGVNLGGMKPEEAEVQLAQTLNYPQVGKIVFEDGEKVWVTKPVELGLVLDVQTSAEAAYALGRSGGPFTRLGEQLGAWHSGKDRAPVWLYDERLAQETINRIAAEVNRQTIEASLSVNGLDVVVLPAQVGRTVDTQATLAALEPQLRRMTDAVVPLVIEDSKPAILDVTQQAEIARSILSTALVLQIPEAQAGDPGPWLIPPEQLAKMLTIQRVESTDGARYQVELDEQALLTYVTALAASINRMAHDARFIFNDETKQLDLLQPAVSGRILDVSASVQAINEKVAQGEHAIPLVLSYAEPRVTSEATGEQLGVRELVSSYTSYFRGSTEERMQNIETAAANFHGLLVAPGEIFSMADAMGSVSLDAGYAEAWIIFGGRTIKGVGGGVCQVSTTLFRTAFFGGFPIIERHPHAYRVSYYEQTRTSYNSELAGLDATVFVPMVDFKFQNDTPYWLLMETYFYPTSRSLTWKFYSTSDGRTVDWETSGPRDIVEPPDPVYEENPELATGVIKQVDWAAEGADVTVTRKVSRDGQALYDDVITTHYLPWGDVYQYGPGTELPTEDGKLKIRKKRTWEPELPLDALPVALMVLGPWRALRGRWPKPGGTASLGSSGIIAQRGETFMVSKELLEILRCPACVREKDGSLELVKESWLVCQDCGRKYPIRDDIPVMLIDEGDQWVTVDAVALPVPPPEK